MAAVDTTALELLGKNISFDLNGICESGTVEAVLISLDGNHEILVGDSFYSLDEIHMN